MCDHEKSIIYDCIECKKEFCVDCILINIDSYYICSNCSNPSILQRLLKFLYLI